MPTEKGISILEIIFSVGVTVLVISGVVSLMVKSTGIKTSAFSRKKAYEMAEMVVEILVDKNKNDRDGFWQLNTIPNEELGCNDGYTCGVGFSRVDTGGCNVSPTPPNCAEAIINVSWDDDSQNITTKRFFSKY